jgi:hypothetical protein
MSRPIQPGARPPPPGSVGTSQLQDGAVTSAKLGSVGSPVASAGDGTHVPVVSMDASGRIFSLSSSAISFPSTTGPWSLANAPALPSPYDDEFTSIAVNTTAKTINGWTYSSSGAVIDPTVVTLINPTATVTGMWNLDGTSRPSRMRVQPSGAGNAQTITLIKPVTISAGQTAWMRGGSTYRVSSPTARTERSSCGSSPTLLGRTTFGCLSPRGTGPTTSSRLAWMVFRSECGAPPTARPSSSTRRFNLTL